jgi:hypothetical protein
VYGSCSFARVRTSDVVPGIDTLPSGVVRRTVWALWGLGEHCRGFISVSLPCNTVSKSSILQLLRLFQISQVVRKFSTYFATRPPTRLPRSNCSLAQVSGYLVAGMPERKYVSISNGQHNSHSVRVRRPNSMRLCSSRLDPLQRPTESRILRSHHATSHTGRPPPT